MPLLLTILQFVGVGIVGISTGVAINEMTDTAPAPAPVHYQEAVMASSVSPLMIISCAILLIAAAYAVKSIVGTLKSCKGETNYPPNNYYE